MLPNLLSSCLYANIAGIGGHYALGEAEGTLTTLEVLDAPRANFGNLTLTLDLLDTVCDDEGSYLEGALFQ